MRRPVVQCKELSCFSSNVQVLHGVKERSQVSDSCFHRLCGSHWATAADCQPVWIVTASPHTSRSSGFCNTNHWYRKTRICSAVISSVSPVHLHLALLGISTARAGSKKSLEGLQIKEMLLVHLLQYPFYFFSRPGNTHIACRKLCRKNYSTFLPIFLSLQNTVSNCYLNSIFIQRTSN